ncbi:calcium-binding tyrosine phosphorylation-regulated protein isoform X1 [Ochotona curzoniae]|uniref:calcium-binding tyrosine phosphorylation-regulated protein isoform X1 n=2 Tax=Ochotona curzoniae TaxID=130825 RepID=UPI001B3519D5|nr:calcium-binding tyrosine phosphorylation-regulated protein isoform X1 [Ochotona curzoniae]XP_040840758.1 calcium-binding tyrosine phosphorylation-regulated protein isoform X1 [Ochotona curzoniae]
MISSKPRLVVPYGLKTLLEGVSRAILRTNPPNITQFAAVYFKELIVFREGNTSLDIKDLVKRFHQIRVEKWSEGATQDKKLGCKKEREGTSVVSQEPTKMEKSTDTEEDNITKPQYSNKTTQFPSLHAEFVEPEMPESARGPSKPGSPKVTTPPSSPSPAAVPAEFAYVPADPAQFAAQMLGNVSSVHSDQSEVLMVDVSTSMPGVPKKVLGSEAAEEFQVTSSLKYSGEVVTMEVVSQTSVQVDLGSKPKDLKAEPTTASSSPLQGEQEPPAPKVPFQADVEITSAVHISSIYNNEPVTEGVVYIEQIPEQIAIPFTDQVACLNENEQSPPVSPRPVVAKTASSMSGKSIEPEKLAQLENEKYDSPMQTVLFADTSLSVQPEGPAEPLDAERFIRIGSAKSLHLEVEIMSVDPDNTGQESRENSAPRDTGGDPVKASSGPFPPAPEGLTEPEMEPQGEVSPDEQV